MNWSYIAGFVDGEGSITHNNRCGFRITIPQTNKEVLDNIQKFTEMGFVIKITKRKVHWKDSWVYYIAGKEDVCNFLKKILPYLIVKKRAASGAIPSLDEDLLKMRERKKIHDRRKKHAKILRSRGLSYRAIGKKLSIDWGYVRRLILDIA